MYCAKFKDVFPFIKNGANIKQDVNAGGIPITRIETLAGGEFNTSRLGYANIFDISPYYEYVLNSGDILMSHINSPAYLGRAVVFEDKYDIVIHGMNLLRLKANKEFIDSRYAVYLFSGNIFKEHIRKITKKSVNQASFSINDLKEIELQLPSIENQVIIAEKLDKLKMLIKKKNRLILFLDEMIKSRFEEVFDLAFINVSLSRYIKSLKSGKSLAGESYNINKVLKTGAVSFDYFNDKEIKNLPVSYTPLESHKVNVGDVIISRMNTAELVGAAGYVWSIDNSVYLPDRLWSAILDENINPIFVWQLIIHPKTKLQIQRIATGTSGSMKNISKQKLLDIKVPWVPIIKQNELSDFVSQINKLKSNVQKSIDETQLLMDSLMQEYFG